MPKPALFDLEEFLQPISAEEPAGPYLKNSDQREHADGFRKYLELIEARRADDDAKSKGLFEKKNPKLADWNKVIKLSSELLKTKTKDLLLATWLVEALMRVHGLVGMRDGLRLFQAMQDRFWETAHPDHGDKEFREGRYEDLDSPRMLPLLIQQVPLSNHPTLPKLNFSVIQLRQTMKLEDQLSNAPAEEREAKEAALFGEDGARLTVIRNAIDSTDRAYHEALREDLAEALAAVEELNESIKAEDHYGADGIPLSTTRSTLEQLIEEVDEILSRSEASSGPEDQESRGKEKEEETWEEEKEEVEAQDEWREGETSGGAGEASRPRAVVVRKRRGGGGGPITDGEDARQRVSEAAAFLRGSEPGDPAGYLVNHALRMAEFFAVGPEVEASSLPAPPTDARQAVQRHGATGDHAAVLEAIQEVMGRGEGRGWLDAHRLAAQALEEQGHDNAARAVRALLRGWLHDYPEWVTWELDDRTPCCHAETRAWLTEQGLLAGGTRAAVFSVPAAAMERVIEAVPSGGGTGGEPAARAEPWDEAVALAQRGETGGALAHLARAAREARTGRERFQRNLEQARICIMSQLPEMALPILEELARQIDYFHLDQWEDTGLSGQVLSCLYQCLSDRKSERARGIYARLCQIDLSLALPLAGTTGASG